MWLNILDYLVCPSCNNSNMSVMDTTKMGDSALNVKRNEAAGYIGEGFITCPKCMKNYPILAGIPILLAGTKMDITAENLFNPSTEHLEYPLEPTKKVAQLLRKHGVDIALDVACGPGAYTSYFECNTLVSSDLSPYFVMKCAEKEGRHFLVADIKNMPFENDTFDLIFASSILEHLKPLEVKQVIAKFNDILKKDGIIQIDLPNSSSVMSTFNCRIKPR